MSSKVLPGSETRTRDRPHSSLTDTNSWPAAWCESRGRPQAAAPCFRCSSVHSFERFLHAGHSPCPGQPGFKDAWARHTSRGFKSPRDEPRCSKSYEETVLLRRRCRGPLYRQAASGKDTQDGGGSFRGRPLVRQRRQGLRPTRSCGVGHLSPRPLWLASSRLQSRWPGCTGSVPCWEEAGGRSHACTRVWTRPRSSSARASWLPSRAPGWLCSGACPGSFGTSIRSAHGKTRVAPCVEQQACRPPS